MLIGFLVILFQQQKIQYIDGGDAVMILKIIRAFKTIITRMLSNAQRKKPMFEKLHMVPFILELKDLQSGMARLMGKW